MLIAELIMWTWERDHANWLKIGYVTYGYLSHRAFSFNFIVEFIPPSHNLTYFALTNMKSEHEHVKHDNERHCSRIGLSSNICGWSEDYLMHIPRLARILIAAFTAGASSSNKPSSLHSSICCSVNVSDS